MVGAVQGQCQLQLRLDNRDLRVPQDSTVIARMAWRLSCFLDEEVELTCGFNQADLLYSAKVFRLNLLHLFRGWTTLRYGREKLRKGAGTTITGELRTI